MNLSEFSKTLHDKLLCISEVCLIAHKNPDGDAIGSLVWLQNLLLDNYNHLKTHICIPEEATPLDPHLSWLLGAFIREIPETCMDIIILDCWDLSRTALAPEKYENKRYFFIDHHEAKIEMEETCKNEFDKKQAFETKGAYLSVSDRDEKAQWRSQTKFFHDFLDSYVDSSASSTTLILTRIARELWWRLSTESSTALLTGIYTDTGGFTHRNTDVDTFEAASFLMSQWADQPRIVQEIFGNYTLSYLHALWQGLQSIVVIDRVACLFLPEDSEYGLKNQIVWYLSWLLDVDIACVLLQNGDHIKGSLRTRRVDIDVNQLAQNFGGGGHKKAAGFELKDAQIVDGVLIWQGQSFTASEFAKKLLSV